MIILVSWIVPTYSFFQISECLKEIIYFIKKYMISIPLRMENPVKSPMVPPISPSAASVVTLSSFSILSKVSVARWMLIYSIL